MKLTTFILFASFMQVCASGFAQKVTLIQPNATLKRVFAEIKKQTGYDVFYQSGKVQENKVIQADFFNASLDQVLEKCLAGQQLSYTIDEKTILVKEKEKSFLDRVIARFEQINVYGVIMDDKGVALPGASIKVKGKTQMTTSDQQGRFSLRGVDESAVLMINYIGYQSRELKAKSEMGNIVLTPSSSALDDVQIIAYGTTTKRLNTGSQAGIKAADIAKQPVNNPLEAMIGRIPGLDITQSSGSAGAGFTIRIRGINSVRPNANDPLFIVDGIPFSSSDMSNGGVVNTTLSPINTLNASDIESIDVLKDADATAIYGSRGANGVILITTKRGGNTSGKTNVDFNVYQGVGEIARTAKLLDTRQYLDMRYKAFQNDGKDFRTAATTDNYDLMTYDTTSYTNWQKEFLGGTAHFTNAQLTINGGNENTHYTFATGIQRQTSVYPVSNSDIKYNGRFTLDNTSSNKKFKAQLTTTFGLDDNHLPTVDLVSTALVLPPIFPSMYTATGELNFDLKDPSSGNNPLQQLARTYNGINKALVSNGILSYEVIPGLVIKTMAGINDQRNDSKIFTPASSFSPAQLTGNVAALRKANYSYLNVFTWNVEPQLNYSKTFNKHKLDILLGTTFQKTNTNRNSITSTGYKDDALLSNLSAAGTMSGTTAISQYNYNAVFARISYNFDNKYILNLTGRRDGSSRFGSGNQFGNFGAAGAAWLFDQEQFIKKALPFLSYGKIRASYGLTGNDIIGDYGYLATYSPVVISGFPTSIQPGYGGNSVLAPDRLENTEIRWETNRKAEVAIELGFLKNRILFNVDYYNNRSGNSLINYTLPATAGFPGIISNLPALIQNTGFEFELTTVNIARENFTWNSSFNLSLPKNKLLRYDGLDQSTYKNTYVVGQPLNIAKVGNNHVDPTTGVYVYTNIAGVVTPAASIQFTDINTPVNLTKQYYGGLNNSLTYKQWSLDIFLQFSKQTGPYTNSTAFSPAPGRINNIPAAMYGDIWQQAGESTTFQKLTSSSSSPARLARLTPAYEPQYYVDAAYMRLKNVALSYTLPKSWQKSIKVENARLYLQGQNLLTFTSYPGMDPENLSSGLPPLRIMTMGVQVTF